ncbi:hypothetical protein H4R18_005177 [Coemansia javaensis]|uniref:Ribosomal protein S21 n=1 Tax=Coemansia javaensis TaxID=2761396 RepID=A0A9W8LDR8_9FUNG|nr:hypothetical protein H4R18_005177 [Coemansia javaensis]
MTGPARRLVSTGSGPAAEGEGKAQTMETRKLFAQRLYMNIFNPSTREVGRTVPVSAGGAGRAYARLNRILSDNNVRGELALRKRYEKPKYKRQRLRRQAHARKFKAEVKKKVQLVYKMKSLGI